jgi:undecaprenyl diphosphate synthase
MSDLIIPNHLGYIVDGNRRWARKHGLPTYEGHLAGYNASVDIVTATFEAGVKYVTCYTFSTENWKRDQEETKNIMNLAVKLLTVDLHIFQDKNVKILFLGSRDKLSKSMCKLIDKAQSTTANNTAGTFSLCFNYGGQDEIVDSVKKIINSGVKAEDVTTELIAKNLYWPEVPPLDLVVRTSGEQRLSNFMLWRTAYSEMIFLKKLWPEMKKVDVKYIINEYNKRSRRFGG